MWRLIWMPVQDFEHSTSAMSTLEPVSTNVGFESWQDTHAVADGDAVGRHTRVPPTPSSVKINVEGAFIVDDEIVERDSAGSEFVHYEHKDIRLPHHTDVVSH